MSPKIDAALSLQMWRAAVSIPSNIAEGHELPTGAYWHHVRIALGSLSEIDTQLELIGRLSMLPAARVRAMQADVAELRRMLRSLRASLMRTAQRNGRPKPRSLE
jgi:four helix bundle protein